jgi:hypothetical protein
MTSDAPVRPRRIRHRCRIPIASGRRDRPGRRLVKDDGPHRSRTPSIAECSLPRARPTLARGRVGSRGARHRCRCSRAGGFHRRDPASGALSPAELACVSRGASGLDPWPFGQDQAPLVDFCNQLDPRARPPTVRSPPRMRKRGPACARALRSPRSPASAWHGRAGAHPHRSRRGSLREGRPKPHPTTRSLHRVRAALLEVGNEAEAPRHHVDSYQPRFHGSGAGEAKAAPALPLPRALASAGERALPQPDPLGHLSS